MKKFKVFDVLSWQQFMTAVRLYAYKNDNFLLPEIGMTADDIRTPTYVYTIGYAKSELKENKLEQSSGTTKYKHMAHHRGVKEPVKLTKEYFGERQGEC